ncbi:hypothetical protein CORMATOL_02088 [Corynebacterium matruchotii ATCC 33806]|uniref:Uncharacterized protein n=1 Tax=Corynebacterium matruchotii ATCC 33806 TaxID=566549 RepID=C0E513_9CORY|nr:hypothetical protein CORMATOL_02088 [Corynebacterium matruchotii ATCC 33806]
MLYACDLNAIANNNMSGSTEIWDRHADRRKAPVAPYLHAPKRAYVRYFAWIPLDR